MISIEQMLMHFPKGALMQEQREATTMEEGEEVEEEEDFVSLRTTLFHSPALNWHWKEAFFNQETAFLPNERETTSSNHCMATVSNHGMT